MGNESWTDFRAGLVPLIAEEALSLRDGVLFRVIRGDGKGRPYGTPRNPSPPPIEVFRPAVGDVPVGMLEPWIVGRLHGISPPQPVWMLSLTEEELVRFRHDDPISAHAEERGFSITGGHHRLHEIVRRVNNGVIDPDRTVRILFHE